MTKPSDVSAVLDADIINFLAEVVEFYGHGSPQARIAERIQRKLGTINIADKYDRLCPTCKCPLCGKTRSQAAAIAKSRQEKGRQKYLLRKQAGVELSQPTADVDDVTYSNKGYSVLDLEREAQRAAEYILGLSSYNVSK